MSGPDAHDHPVLPGTDPAGYLSVRHRPEHRDERRRRGKALRKQVPRSALGDWAPPVDRPDPVSMIIESNAGRVESLVPIRMARMIESPYGYLRGSAAVVAHDAAHLPSTGITPVVCGDAHLGNFGFYASPERELVLDLNDFDEAHPGRWEWDLRRLVTSVWVAGRQNGASEQDCRRAVLACVAAYRGEVRELAGQSLLSRSFERLVVDELAQETSDRGLRAELVRAAARARKRTSDRAVPRFTEEHGPAESPTRRIVEEPPLITRLPGAEIDELAGALDDYLRTLAPHWRRILGGYTLLDIAHKVVGVGSVGLRAYVALLEGSGADDVIFLQIKQARRSVLARHVHGDAAWHDHQGQRVVEYQQMLQTVSDPLLGWLTAGGRQYYVRQFRDMKGTVALDAIDAAALDDYAGVLGHLLAKGHARTSGASMIAGYVGGGDQLDRALARFAQAYADQTEADHEALVSAARKGLVPCG